MVDPLLRKSLRDLRGQALGWGVGMGMLLVLTVALYPSISSIYGDMIRQLPEGWLAFFGGDFSLDTLEGYLNAEFFSYAPVALAVFAILAGTAALAGEEGRGTLDLLLAQPVERSRLALTKLLGVTLANGLVIAVMLVLFWATTPFVDMEVPTGRILAAFALLWPFETVVAFLSVLLSLVFSGRLLAGTIMAVVLVASYILDSLANLVSGLEALRPLYLTAYFQGDDALVAQISWTYVAGLLGLLVVSLVLSVVLFQRRDIGVRSALPLMSLLRRRRQQVRAAGR